MLEMSQLYAIFRKLFTDRTYGESLEHYINSRNPQNSADIEHLERQWQYKSGGQWL